MLKLIYLAPVVGVIALIFAGIKAVSISKKDTGTERMKEIASSIAEGARAFLFSEYKVLVVFVVVLVLILGFGKITGMGVAGAAIATVISQIVVSTCFIFKILRNKEEYFKISLFIYKLIQRFLLT